MLQAFIIRRGKVVHWERSQPESRPGPAVADVSVSAAGFADYTIPPPHIQEHEDRLREMAGLPGGCSDQSAGLAQSPPAPPSALPQREVSNDPYNSSIQHCYVLTMSCQPTNGQPMLNRHGNIPNPARQAKRARRRANDARRTGSPGQQARDRAADAERWRREHGYREARERKAQHAARREAQQDGQGDTVGDLGDIEW